jgi:hypothetical protein
MSRDEDEISDIITQIQDLHIQQAGLISRLERLSTSGESNDTTAPSPPDTTRAFAIGDKVLIKNPRVLQARKGKIVKIGATRITVKASNGTKIVRAPKNLLHE